MKSTAVVTDSNSGITQSQSKDLGITVLPMPFYIDGVLYLEDISLTQSEFYKKLAEDSDISTSQPAPGDVIQLWDRLLKDHDEVLHLPMSSGLSSSYETAHMLAKEYGGRVEVVNNQRISVTQRQSVLDAAEFARQGRTALEIKQILEDTKKESSIYITVDTLKYLKKGGRITAAAAAVGTILNLKPVLQIQGDKLDAYAKARGKNTAKKIMLEAMKKDFEGRFEQYAGRKGIYLQGAYAGNREEAEEWAKEIQHHFPGFPFHMDPLSLSVACHIGYGALAIACSCKITE